MAAFQGVGLSRRQKGEAACAEQRQGLSNGTHACNTTALCQAESMGPKAAWHKYCSLQTHRGLSVRCPLPPSWLAEGTGTLNQPVQPPTPSAPSFSLSFPHSWAPAHRLIRASTPGSELPEPQAHMGYKTPQISPSFSPR